MHYGIVGIGPVGAVFAAHLNKAGHRVSVVDLNVHRQNYLTHNPLIISGKMNVETQLTKLYTDMFEFANQAPEVIFLCIKTNHTATVLKQLKAYGIGDKTIFVSTQNGIDAEEDIAAVFGDERALRQVIHFGCNYVRKSEVWVEFSYSNFLSNKGEKSRQIAEDLNNAGLKTVPTSNYKEEAFKKAILNTSLSSICALTRLTMREVMEEEELVRMVRRVTQESISVAIAMGLNIKEQYLDEALDYLYKGGDHKPSMLIDIEQKRITENEYHAGRMFMYAEKHGIDVPVIQTVYYLLKNLERGVIMDSYVSEGMRTRA